MMNGSKLYAPLGGRRWPSPKRRRPRLRVSCSPSPHPSPPGEGETFARALIIRPSLVVVCLRNERQRSGDGKRNVRILQGCPSALPLLGERVGVRGNEANSNPGARRFPELSNFAGPPTEPGVSQSGHRSIKEFNPDKSLNSFAPDLVIRPSLVAVWHRNESQRGGDCNCNIRIFQCRASALPLLGERVGVRGNEATSNPSRTTTPGTVKLRESPGRAGAFPI